VNVTSTGDSQFSVPTFATIAEGKRLGELTVTYDPSALTYNQVYTINLSIADSKSIYGYKQAQAVIEFPTSYSEYGSGTIVEGWWGEQEDKVMYRRDYAANVYQCYLPDCWGHDSGAGYAVQNYVFYWNTETNMVYCPLRPMGTDNWCIADRGAIACMFGGPGYKEGSSDWMKYIDDWYKSKGFAHPYYDPAKKSFFLSDSAAVSPETGAVVYGTPGEFDVFTLK